MTLKKNMRISILSLLAIVLSAINFTGFAETVYVENSATEQTAETPDPMALLKSATQFIGNQKHFSLQATITDDKIIDNQKVQFARQVSAILDRNEGLKVIGDGLSYNRTFWYDGNTVTVLNRTKNTYVQIPAKTSLDATLDNLALEYGVQPPLIDLFYIDPYEGIAPNIEKSQYYGMEKINGNLCHHLMFNQKSINFQLWVDVGNQPFIRKVVITYKTEPLAPQYTAVFDSWNISAPTSDSIFQSKIPSSAKKIELSANQ